MDHHNRSFEERTEVAQSSRCSLEVPQHWQKNRNAKTQTKEKVGEKRSLKKRQEMVIDTKPYHCLPCEKGFSDKNDLELHNIIHNHNKAKEFKCLQCGKDLSSKQSLAIHGRTHTGEKPFKCSQCGKDFTTKQSMMFHERTHTGEKPFKCSQCGKDFTTKQSLLLHGRTHTGEKPLKCSQCGTSFRDKSTFRKHERRMHDCRKQEETHSDIQPGSLMSLLLEFKFILTCTQDILTDSNSDYLQLLEKMTIWRQSGYNVVMGTYLHSDSERIVVVNGQNQLSIQFIRIGDKVDWILQLESTDGGATGLVAKGSSSNFYRRLVTCLERFLMWEQAEPIKVEVEVDTAQDP